MLVGCRMENVLRLVTSEDFLHTRHIGDIGNDSLGINISPTVLQLQTDIMQRSFSLVHKNQLIRIERSHLTHNLTTDRPGSTCNHHSLAFQMRSNFVNINFDRITLQQILYLNFFQLGTIQKLIVPLAQWRSRHQLYVMCQQAVCHIRMFERFHFCRRNDNGMHIPVIQILNQRVIIRENLNPHHHLVDQFRFIGYETAQAVMITKTDAQCLCNIYSGLFGSINKHIGTARTIEIQRFEEDLHNNAGTCHHGKTDDIGHEQHRYGSHIYVCKAFHHYTRYQQQCIRHSQCHEDAHDIYKR